MISTRLAICAATVGLLSAAPAAAEPAYVPSTVNLRSAAGTSNEIVAKIPGGSLVDASNCTEWCEVEWQGKKGFAIATALDRSGRVPAPRRAAPRGGGGGGVITEGDYEPVGPPAVYGGPIGVPIGAPLYYPYRYYGYGYRPYYWGYGRGYVRHGRYGRWR